LSRSAVFTSLKILCALCVLCGSCFCLDRDAFTFVNYDLHAQVAPSAHDFAANGVITLRNDSSTPQKNISLQISSSLEWKSIRVNGKEVLYITQPYQSDIDHTGVVSEAVITLPSPIAPKQTVDVEVSYAGTIQADSTRLTRIGTPEQVALENDWDRISPDFTAVRGVGYVCWYPVSMEPANLSEGNRYFDVLGDWKQRNSGATMKLALETAGKVTSITNGTLTGSSAREALNPDQPSTRESTFTFQPIGFFAPSFAVGEFSTLDRPSISITHTLDHSAAAQEFALAAEKIGPTVTGWFGPQRQKVRVVELADSSALPFDSGATVFTPLRTSNSDRAQFEIAHQIAHACLPPSISRLWISEGLAQFAQALVREDQSGRKGALAWMNAYIPALVSTEEQSQAAGAPRSDRSAPAERANVGTPEESQPAGQSLVNANDPAYYNIKAMFVWWMLRDMVGNDALQHAVRAYYTTPDKDAATFQKLVEAQSKKDLEWFFDDWVYRDRSLPDFTIQSAFSRPLLSSSSSKTEGVSVTVTVANLGNAGAEVPVVVHTAYGEMSDRVVVKAKSTAVVRIQVPSKPTSVTVNDGSVPEAVINNNTYTFGEKK
jgi:hypothetical protein